MLSIVLGRFMDINFVSLDLKNVAYITLNTREYYSYSYLSIVILAVGDQSARQASDTLFFFLQGKTESLHSLLFPSRRDTKRGTVQYISTSAPVQLRYTFPYLVNALI